MVVTGTWQSCDEPETIIEEEGEEDSVAEEEVERLRSEFAALKLEVEAQAAEAVAFCENSAPGTATTEQTEALRSLSSKLASKQEELKERKRYLAEKETKLQEGRVREQAVEVERLHKEEKVQQVLETVARAECVDLAFIVDCTASMKNRICSVKLRIQEIIAGIRKTNPGLCLRLAMVGYRDTEYTNPLEICDFDENVSTFVAFLAGLRTERVRANSDRPEDMASGLKAANELAWSSATRVAVIIADNPCHGKKFHDLRDRYPNGTPGVDVIEELMRLSRKEPTNGSMNLFFGRVRDTTDKMCLVFREHVELSAFDVSMASGVVRGVKNGVRSSIFRTISATVQVEPFSLNARENTEVSFPVAESLRVEPGVPTEEAWGRAELNYVMMMCNVPIRTLTQLEKPVRTGFFGFVHRMNPFKRKDENESVEKTPVFLKQAPKPFAEGGSRFAFYGRLSSQSEKLAHSASAVILKTYKSPDPERHNLKNYLDQMEASSVANFLAKEFNKSMARPRRCKEVFIYEVRVLEGRDEQGNPSMPRFCAERPLPEGKFFRFCNNTGFWDPDKLDETLLRFCKFTNEITRGFLMVVDLQGVHNEFGFHLTDPAIHCKDLMRFGSTNLGEQMMKKCLEATNALLEENGWD